MSGKESSEKPVYKLIKQRIQEIIESENLSGGDFLPPLRELASKFGTTTVTVSRATQELAQEGKLLRMPRKGILVSPEFSSKPNKTSWSLILPESGYTEAKFIRAIRQESQKKGISIDFHTFSDKEGNRRSKIFEAIQDGSAAIMLLPGRPASASHKSDHLGYLMDLPVPVVLLDHWEPEREAAGVDFVLSDNFSGGYQATVHMIRHGYKKIAVLNGPSETGQVFMERLKGYEAALADHGIEPIDLPPIIDISTGSFSAEKLDTYIDYGVEAFVVTNDYSAMLLLSQLEELGRNIPEDIAIISYGDTPLSSLTSPGLTTMRPNVEKIVEKAFELLIKRIETPTFGRFRTILIRPEIICRGSCGVNCHLA